MARIDIKKLLSFSELIYAFERVSRADIVPETDRHENDAEHSYHLAMLAWYAADTCDLALDKTLLLRYALAHDLVEAYAGDTFAYSKDTELHSSKHAREREARARLKREFPDFKELHASIEAYEKQSDAESRFIYALDKIAPMLVCYADTGRAWKKWDVTLDDVSRLKREKVANHPEVKPVLEDLLAILEKEREALFPK